MKPKPIEENETQRVSEGTGLRVRIAQTEEKEWFDRVVEENHELGAGKAVGDYLRQVVERRGVAVALLTWGPACYALKDRAASAARTLAGEVWLSAVAGGDLQQSRIA